MSREQQLNNASLSTRFRSTFGRAPAVIASAPGRLEVLGNHTDYNAGLTLSCAVAFRCHAALAPLDEPAIQLATTMLDAEPSRFKLSDPRAPHGRWENYVLGLVDALLVRGFVVPGFAMLIDSAVPRSAGVSSSAALEIAALTALSAMMQIDLPPIELARLGQHAESRAVGAQTGLLDQLTALLGRRDHLIRIDFQTNQTQAIALPPGWCFFAIDSGVKHDLTIEYNQRRRACEAAARAMHVATLREANLKQLDAERQAMPDDAYRGALHVIGESQRVERATDALRTADVQALGQLMFESHQSSQDYFRNSCAELDQLVEWAQQDERCAGARLSGGGFGGISIHLVEQHHAEAYRADLLAQLDAAGQPKRWSAVCTIDDAASVQTIA